jgi:hypothetical protein
MTASSQARAQTSLNQALDWFDQLPKPAKIGIMVVGFVLFWPIGLAVLGYLLWSGQMGCRHGRHEWGRSQWGMGGFGGPRGSSGNMAFDEYREATLRQLEEDQREFALFMDKLRRAKDQQEFDTFMSERMARKTAENGKDKRPGEQ